MHGKTAHPTQPPMQPSRGSDKKASPPTPSASAPAPGLLNAKIVVPVSYGAWLNGDIGQSLQKALRNGLCSVDHVRITLLPRAFLVEADEAPGPLLEAVSRAARDLDRAVQKAYPVFHHDFGPIWNGTLQAVFA